MRSSCAKGVVVCVLLLLAGCASVDPSADYDRAAALVQDRTGGLGPVWPNGGDTAAMWDGASALDADTAVRVALAANAVLLAQAQAVAAGRADVAQAGLLPNPVLGLTLGFPGGGEDGATSVSISLVQQLAALWTRGDKIAAAEGELDAQILSVSDAALELAARVRLAHARALSAERVHGLTGEHAVLLDKLVEVARRRIDAGEATRLDLTRLMLARRTLEANLRSADLERVTARHQLLALMGRADGPAVFPFVERAEPVVTLPDERGAMDLAVHQRLDVAVADARRRAALSKLARAKGEQIPEIDAGAGYASDDDRVQEIGPKVNIEIPIFDNGRAGVAKAAANARAAEFALREARQRALGEARSALARARAADDLAAFTRDELLTLSAETLELARSSVAGGQADTTVLLDAQGNQIQARLGLARAELRSVEARIELARALGGRIGSVMTAAAPPTSPRVRGDTTAPASSR